MGIFQSPTPPGVDFTHPFKVRRRAGTDHCRIVCGCGWASDWMLTEPAAMHEATRHYMTGSNTWHWGG